MGLRGTLMLDIDYMRCLVDNQDGDGHPDPTLWNNISAAHKLRFDRTGKGYELRLAIEAARRAVELSPPNDLKRVEMFMNLITCEFLQAMYLHDLEYLEQARVHLKEAWSIRRAKPVTGDYGERQTVLQLWLLQCTHAYVFDTLFEEGPAPESVEYMDATINNIKDLLESLESVPAFANDPQLVRLLDFLSVLLGLRWRREPVKMTYLDEAISIARDLTEARPDEPLSSRDSLAGLLYYRYRQTGDIHCEDSRQALSKALETYRSSESLPHSRLDAGRWAIDILSDLGDWDNALKLSEGVVNLLEILNGRSLGWRDKQNWVREFSHGAAKYASIALEAGSDVLNVIKILERCRGSILGHLIDNRTDLNDLMEAAPEVAEQLKTLMAEINTGIDPCGYMETQEQTGRKMRANKEIRSCLRKLRTLERGPTQRELEAAAARGPIVIVNISQIRSDAIIITHDAFIHLPLPQLTYQKAKSYLDQKLTKGLHDFMKEGDNNNKCRGMQKWLWDTCVKFIFDELDKRPRCQAKLHVWWIGVGIANAFPFHAAGNYTSTKKVQERALNRAISSYAPTIKVLINGRRKLNYKDGHVVADVQGLPNKLERVQCKPRLAVITMPYTPHMKPLKGVETEADELMEIVRDNYEADKFRGPSAKDTMAHMSKREIMHFACHGQSNIVDPSSSQLCLQKPVKGGDSTSFVGDNLTLRDVAAADLSHGKLAFLSACSTAQDGRSGHWDEGLHLASGFQVAGFLHVVGNLWPADDNVSVEVVKEFYKHLVAAGDFGNGDHVAEALNKASMYAAKKNPNRPLSWANFVHFGI